MNLKITDARAAEIAFTAHRQSPSWVHAVVQDFLSDRTTMAAEIERLTRQLQEAQKVFDAMRKWEDDGDYDNEVAMIQARLSYSAMARQAPETAPGSDLPEGAATHVAGEAK